MYKREPTKRTCWNCNDKWECSNECGKKYSGGCLCMECLLRVTNSNKSGISYIFLRRRQNLYTNSNYDKVFKACYNAKSMNAAIVARSL